MKNLFIFLTILALVTGVGMLAKSRNATAFDDPFPPCPPCDQM